MPHSNLTTLTTTESWALVAEQSHGQLAFIEPVGVFPMIIPVRYRLTDHTVIIDADTEIIRAAADRNAPAALAVSGRRPGGGRQWSVVVQGRTEMTADEAGQGTRLVGRKIIGTIHPPRRLSHRVVSSGRWGDTNPTTRSEVLVP